MFDKYVKTLESMGKLARLAYCDSGIIYDCLQNFSTLYSKEFNNRDWTKRDTVFVPVLDTTVFK
jgi:hypothetical protein